MPRKALAFARAALRFARRRPADAGAHHRIATRVGTLAKRASHDQRPTTEAARTTVGGRMTTASQFVTMPPCKS